MVGGEWRWSVDGGRWTVAGGGADGVGNQVTEEMSCGVLSGESLGVFEGWVEYAYGWRCEFVECAVEEGA